MKSAKSFMYTTMGMTFLVILPFFLIVSFHIKKTLPQKEYIVTNVSGNAATRYQVRHLLGDKSKKNQIYSKKSEWIPLAKGIKLGDDALIKTEKDSFVDVILKDGIAFRVKQASLVKLKKEATKQNIINLVINSGKILCCFLRSKKSMDQMEPETFRVSTPEATVKVKGTMFSVCYFPDERTTQVAVLNGAVRVMDDNGPGDAVNVFKDNTIQVAPFFSSPVAQTMSPEVREELLEIRKLKIKATPYDRWNQTMELVVESPLYRKALNIITDYEMKLFKRAVIYYARLCWHDMVPEKLRSIELEDGDYKDPWNTDYFYERIGPKEAVLISAGPDKILHTSDDIFMSINL